MCRSSSPRVGSRSGRLVGALPLVSCRAGMRDAAPRRSYDTVAAHATSYPEYGARWGQWGHHSPNSAGVRRLAATCQTPPMISSSGSRGLNRLRRGTRCSTPASTTAQRGISRPTCTRHRSSTASAIKSERQRRWETLPFRSGWKPLASGMSRYLPPAAVPPALCGTTVIVRDDGYSRE